MENTAKEYNFYGRRRGKKLNPSREVLLRCFAPKVRLPVFENGQIVRPSDLFPEKPEKVWLEIGFGGGEHLAEQSFLHPDIGFIGAEVYLNGVTSLLAHLTGTEGTGNVPENIGLKQGRVDNVRIYDDDVRDLFKHFTPAGFDRIYVLFPDPWPKKRHADRRFIGSKNLPVLASLLKKGGQLRIASDDMNYIRWSLRHLMASNDFEWLARTADDWRKPPTDWVKTRYEQKALKKGAKPVYLSFERL